MSIFKRALEALVGKKELQEQLNNEKQITKEQQNIITHLANENIKLQQPCKNKLIYNANNQYVVVIDCNDDTFEGYVSPEKMEKLKTVTTEEIIALLTPAKVKEKQEENNVEKEEKGIVSNFLDIFDGVEDFEVVGDKVFFSGVKSVEIPSLIVARFVELIEKISYFREQYSDNHASFETEDTLKLTSLEQEYESLKAFTLKLLTSPRQESINQVLSFCRHNDLRISKKGNIIAYRRVKEFTDVTMPDNSELATFVQESVDKVKKWKKSVKNYEVFDDNGYVFVHTDKVNAYNKHVGNLYELYNNQSALKPETTKLYTSSHNYGKYTFAIGDIYKAEEGDIDVDAGQCHSGGLHFAACSYNYSGYGSQGVVVLINPAKTITIPLNEVQKGRTTEMKIACLNPNEIGIHIDESLIEEADEQYNEYTLEELQQVISQKTLKPLSVEEEVTNLSIPEVVNIKDLLSKRVVNI